MTRFLDDETLEQFEDALRDAGAAITRVWAPGLTDAEITALTEPLGLELPEEARRWWRWHNGVRDQPGPAAPDCYLTPRRPFFDLATCLEGLPSQRELRDDLYGGLADLLQPVGDRPSIFFACSGTHDEPVVIYTQEDIDDPVLALPSIGELVTRWTQLVRDEVFETDSNGHWTPSFEKAPQETRRLGIY